MIPIMPNNNLTDVRFQQQVFQRGYYEAVNLSTSHWPYFLHALFDRHGLIIVIQSQHVTDRDSKAAVDRRLPSMPRDFNTSKAQTLLDLI